MTHLLAATDGAIGLQVGAIFSYVLLAAIAVGATTKVVLGLIRHRGRASAREVASALGASGAAQSEAYGWKPALPHTATGDHHEDRSTTGL